MFNRLGPANLGFVYNRLAILDLGVQLPPLYLYR